uniref:Secreted protein n=1 Tax=Steinernema glaseri TaxID=37863 RepID=A0A1I7Y2Z1_9BILA
MFPFGVRISFFLLLFDSFFPLSIDPHSTDQPSHLLEHSPSTSSPESTPEDPLVGASQSVIKATALAIYGGEVLLQPLVQFFREVGHAVREVAEWSADVDFLSAPEGSRKDKVQAT